MELTGWYKKKNHLCNNLIEFQVFFILVAFFMETSVGMPHAAIYITDIITLALFLLTFEDLIRKNDKFCRRTVCLIGLFAVYTLIDFLLNGESVLYYVWGLRNVFRFYLFFMSCMYCVKLNVIEKMMHIFEIFLYINVLVCSWQFFILKLPFDNIGGFFGIATQSSGYMNVLLVLVTVMAVIRYLKQMDAVRPFLIKIACSVYISVISELKVYYIELALIVFMALLMETVSKKRWNKKMLKAGIICAAGMMLLAAATVRLNPGYWKGFFSPAGIWREATRASGYSASGDLNRLTAIPYIFEHIFGGGLKSVLGFGLGNCDYSSNYSFLTSSFYSQYQSLHYVWFCAPFLFLELGFAGLIIYISLFCMVAMTALQNSKKYKLTEEEKFWNQVAAVVSLCCIFFMLYNNCLRTEAAYMLYFVLSFPFVIALRHWKGAKV